MTDYNDLIGRLEEETKNLSYRCIEYGSSESGMGAALADEAAAALGDLIAERRNIVSHATMGHTTGEDMSMNDVCVEISRSRAYLYQMGKDSRNDEVAKLIAQRDAMRKDRADRYLADMAKAKQGLDALNPAVRDRLEAWQEGQGEWFDPTVLEIVAEFIAFDDAASKALDAGDE